QGRRKYMEDAVIVIPDLRSDEDPFSMFAVFDGHGGIEAARWAVENLWKFLALLLHEGREPEEALRTSFSMAGCTAAVVLVRRDEVWAANAGDTQIVLLGDSRGGRGEQLCEIHRPDNENERRRVEELGGFIKTVGVPRLNGVLAVTRSLGDFSLHPHLTSEPFVTKAALLPDDRHLVIATDG
ncbi:hypothetical protein GUITHDRAFT_48451, partial [Guillardia theta CCMP2712]